MKNKQKKYNQTLVGFGNDEIMYTFESDRIFIICYQWLTKLSLIILWIYETTLDIKGIFNTIP